MASVFYQKHGVYECYKTFAEGQEVVYDLPRSTVRPIPEKLAKTQKIK